MHNYISETLPTTVKCPADPAVFAGFEPKLPCLVAPSFANFDIDNAQMCVMGIREIAFNAPTYNVKVRERRGNETREFRLKPGEHGWIGWSLYSGW